MGQETGSNTEYWFRLIYECLTQTAQTCHISGIPHFDLTGLWLWITWIGYILSIIALFIIIYATIRIFQLRLEEEEQLEHLIPMPEGDEGTPRWAHIESLMGSGHESDFRQAIIEADILLDDILSRQGYQGNGVAEKLQKVEPSDMDTIQDAWEAHKVRNQIAHAGSTFDLSETLARRTIARYESVFREFQLI